jgi:hypothetical protein
MPRLSPNNARYTAIRTASQNIAFTCMIYFFVNIYYGTLYAYTPEVLPSAHRATGNGIAVACNRVMGLVSAFVATYADTATSAPIYICAAMFIAMVRLSASFPTFPILTSFRLLSLLPFPTSHSDTGPCKGMEQIDDTAQRCLIKAVYTSLTASPYDEIL